MTDISLKPGRIWVRISDCCDQISDRVDNPSESGYERFVGLEHMKTREVYIRNWGSTSDVTSAMKLFKAGDILVARRNVYLERAATPDFDGVCSGDAIVLRAKDGPCLPDLIPFILNTDRFWAYANSQADGSMSKRLSVARLMEYEFPLPPLDEQHRIALLLSGLENHLFQLTGSSQKIDQLRKAFLINQFNRLLHNKTKIVKVSQAGDVLMGRQRSPQYNKNISPKPYLRVANVFDGYLPKFRPNKRTRASAKVGLGQKGQ